jgi:dTDP-4-amino-4,6-dideoxygalactose transaminase
MTQTITVTKPYLPDREKYLDRVSGIFERRWLTNHGPLVTELEEKIYEYTGVPGWFLSNGTIALQIAIKALELKAEIITTPFSYVATTNAILWENCTPVFADIDPHTCNISPESIESRISSQTTAILATHVYGIPCDTEAIEAIAQRYKLRVIYDGAHAFGCSYKGKALFSYGDICTASYHATKLFHTSEGGGVFTTNPDFLERMRYLRNFGHEGPEQFVLPGVNGKNSEFHAAMGLCVLPDVPQIIARRKDLSLGYKERLRNSPVRFPDIPGETEYNYAYFPVIFSSEKDLLKTQAFLESNQVGTRRYFYPSLNRLDYLSRIDECPVAEDISKRVLCLPLYPDLTFEEIDFITGLITRCF